MQGRSRFFSKWEFEWKCSVDGGSTYPRAACYFEGDFLLPGRENVARVNEKGKTIWNLQFGKGNIMGCLVCGKKALVLSKGASSTISIIDTRDGFLYESMKLDGQPMTVPVQTENGFVIVFAKQGLVCYKGSNPPKLDWAVPENGIIRCAPGQKVAIPIKISLQGKSYRETRIVLTSETETKIVLFCVADTSDKN